MTTNWSPQVSRAMHELSNAAPPAPSIDGMRVSAPSPGRHSRVIATATAGLIISAMIVGLILIARRDHSTPVGIDVHHTRIQVALDADLKCDKPIDTTGTFPSMTIDAYSDRAGRRWRNTVTYPDGTTRDLIAIGSAAYPTHLWVRGLSRGSTFGCVGPAEQTYVLGGEPGQGSFYTLTSADELASEERPLVPQFDNLGQLQPGEHTDSQGRPTRLWQQRIEGFAGYGDDATYPLTQVTSWWVDPSDGATVTERIFTNSVDGIGSLTDTQTMTVDETTTVDDGLFGTDGYSEVVVPPRPDAPANSVDARIPDVPPTVGDAAVRTG